MHSMRTDQTEGSSVAASAASQLREAIVFGELPMGAPLAEEGIVQRLGIPRSAARAALRILAQEGIVELRPYGGAHVFRLEEPQLRQLVTFREMLEGAAVEEALKLPNTGLADTLKAMIARMRGALVARDRFRYLALDADFHEAILAAAQNPFLCQSYHSVASRIAAVRNAVATEPLVLQESFNGHLHLLRRIESQDVRGARQALQKHLRGSRAVPAGRQRAH